MPSPKKPAWLLFGATLLVYLLTMGGHLYSPDEELMFRTVESLAETRSSAIESADLGGFATRTGKDGRQYAQYGLGQPLAALPFYYFGKIVRAILPPAHKFWRSAQITFAEPYHGEHLGDQGSYWPRFGVSLFNQFTAAALAVVLFLFCFELTQDRRAALLTAILYAFGTMAWPHSKPFFSETLAALCIMLAFYFIVRGQRTGSLASWFWCGFFAAYAVFTRMDSLFAYPGLLLYFLWSNHRSADPDRPYEELIDADKRPSSGGPGLPLHTDFWKRFLAAGAPLAAFALLMMGLNYLHFGHPLALGYSDQAEGIKFATPLHVGVYGFLFSVGKGLFFFSPPLALLFLAIGPFWRRRPGAAASLLLSAVCFLLVQAKWQNWGGGWCWGPRHIFLLCALLAAPLVALAVQWDKRWVKALYAASLLIGGCVQVYGCSQSFIDFYYYSYRLLDTPPNAHLNYSPVEDEPLLAERFFLLQSLTRPPAISDNVYLVESPDGQILQMRRVSFASLPPPLAQSFYLVEQSTWHGYAALWREQGKHDFFWLWVLGVPSRESASAEVGVGETAEK